MSNSNEYMRKYMREYRQRLVEEAKVMLGGKCIRCGSTDGLEFDHIDRATKTFQIGGAKVASRRRIMDEARKCQLLCKEHHLEKSYETGDLIQAQHGVANGQRYKRGCRCVECRTANRDAMRAYRAKKRGDNPV